MFPGEPPIWIQRLVIVPVRRPGVNWIRNIEFRRGLNVINTKVTQDTESTAFGHNVGKTLLVRMIRYALGDEFYANARIRGKIREGLRSEGAVLAVARVKGSTWCVARSLVNPRQSFCLQSDNWQDLLADAATLHPFADFQSALDQLLPTDCFSVRVARGRRQPAWTDLLGWLIRDQHCRYTSHNTWRFQADESDPDVLLDSEANLIVRVAMKVFDRREYELTEQLEQLRARLRRLQNELTHIRQERERTAQLMTEEAGISHDLAEGGLGQAAIRGQIEQQRTTYQEQLGQLPEATALEEAEQQLIARRAERDRIDGRIDQLQRDLQRTKEALALARRPDDQAALAQRRRDLSCGLEGCLHLTASSLPPDPNRQDRIREHQADIQRLENEMAVASADFDQKKSAVRDAEIVVRDARRRLEQAAAEPRQNMARCNFLLRRLETFAASLVRRESVEGQRRSTETQIQQIEHQREARANSRKRQMERLNETFQEVANGLIRRSMGKLSLDLRSGLVPNPDGLSGEAFGSAGHVVGFDLTCLSASINGNGFHPRLLIHDSPREADLHELIYRNLFRYALSLESRFPGEAPAFQYIITTTSPPPDPVKPEHIRETLHDETADGRLLRFEF